MLKHFRSRVSAQVEQLCRLLLLFVNKAVCFVYMYSTGFVVLFKEVLRNSF